MTLAIETRAVSVAFGAVPGIVDLDLEVPAGSVFGFLGPNGSGKTTTIKVLLDLLRPDRGEAFVLGCDVATSGPELRARIGFLPSEVTLFPHLTGEATLRFFAELYGRPPVLRETVLEALGFPRPALRRRVKTYSTGMRQMIGITAAFQHDPELLILDEPTSGLDPIVRDAFLTLVRGCRERGRTVFLSSHVLDEIERCADVVGLIANARLRLVESVDTLRKTRARQVICRYDDGRVVEYARGGDPTAMLDGIERRGLVDVEIRPASLDEVFRSVVQEEPPA